MHWIFPSIGGALFGFGLGSFGDTTLTFVIDSYKDVSFNHFWAAAWRSTSTVQLIYTDHRRSLRCYHIRQEPLQHRYGAGPWTVDTRYGDPKLVHLDGLCISRCQLTVYSDDILWEAVED